MTSIAPFVCNCQYGTSDPRCCVNRHKETPVPITVPIATLTASPIVFKRTDLIEAAQRVVDRYDRALAAHAEQVKAYRQEHLQNWQAKHTEGVRAFRDYLTACLKKGVAPLDSKVTELVGTHAFYTVPDDYVANQRIKKPKADGVAECRALIELLRLHTGETISAGQLKTFGFGAKMLNELFSSVARATPAAAK
jgi:hypothetical protein